MSIYARLHAFYKGLFKERPQTAARTIYKQLEKELHAAGGCEAIKTQIVTLLHSSYPHSQAELFEDDLRELVDDLFAFDNLFELPAFDWSTAQPIAAYWNLSEQCETVLGHLRLWQESPERFARPLTQILAHYLNSLPSTEHDDYSLTISCSLLHSIDNPGHVLDVMCGSVHDSTWVEHKLFLRLRQRIYQNLVRASGGNPHDGDFKKPFLEASKAKIDDTEVLVRSYVGGTPLLQLFSGSLPFSIPLSTRYEHHHIVAGSGHGKTQTLQYMIAKDLEAIVDGKRSIVVMDSQGDLIRNIANLKLFASGEPLHNRLVLIDPTDVEYPVSLNLFDVGQKRLLGYSQLERERLTNSIIELYDFVLGSLLSAEMTQKQNVIFRYVTRLMLQIPDATIQTLRALMEPKSEITFAPYIEKLTGSARAFFETEFGSSEFTQTRKQVLRRLWGILENQSFERMFSHPRSKLDLYEEMNAGKVILINTAKDLLKDGGTEIFGRFFIALIVQAAQERAVLPEHRRVPTFVYIDEAADYFDKNFATMLSQARKQKVGMVLAHQYLGQLDPKLLDAFAANTSIKFAGGVSSKDSRQLAQMLGTTPEFIEGQHKGTFAASVRGVTKTAVPLSFPFGYLEKMPKMTRAERDQLLKTMRQTYAVSALEEAEEQAEKPVTTRGDKDDFASEW